MITLTHTRVYIYVHTHADTLILPPAHVDWQSQALSLDKRQRRTGEQAELTIEGARKRGTGCLTPFLEPSLSNDGDIAHGFFTPSLMPLHACSTEREREEGRGGEERREGEKERERRRGGGPALPASASLSLPSFPDCSLGRAVSLLGARTHKRTVRVCCFLLWLICLPPSPLCRLLLPLFLRCLLHSRSLLQTFFLTRSDSAWKEVIKKKQ